jgi:excinuclease ABC subunit C
VENESDALLLENNLIKRYKPKYNILLKDSKTFPWICIKKENYPRVFSTRNYINDGSVYYGPYTSARMVKILIDMIKKLFQLRSCNLNLDEKNILKGKYRACLEYDIGNCKAPCEGKQKKENYDETIDQIKNILKGNLNEVLKFLNITMEKYSKKYDFENAEIIKNKIRLLENYKHKSTIVNVNIHNVDVFSIIEEKKITVVNYIKVIKGAIVQTYTVEIKMKIDENIKDLLSISITDLRVRTKSESKEIIIPFYPGMKMENIKYTIPKIGDKKKLLELSVRNCKMYIIEKIKLIEKKGKEGNEIRILKKMKEDLKLINTPVHIECFDNSNLFGKNPVASCVVFRNGKPSKSEYRHFNVKTVEGINDFKSMSEIVFRRYKRMIDEKKELPQLIVIDGGKGQLNAALKSLEKLNINKKITMIGIAKKLEEIYFPNDPVPLYIDKTSETLKIIQQLRNEAHRFGITFHRKKRSKSMIMSELDNIKGIGEKTKKLLLEKFNSIDEIKTKKEKELIDVIGENKSKIIYNYFNK